MFRRFFRFPNCQENDEKNQKYPTPQWHWVNEIN